MASLPKEKSIELLRRTTDRIRALVTTTHPSLPEMEKLVRDARLLITNIFGEETSQRQEVEAALKIYTGLSESTSSSTKSILLQAALSKLAVLLESIAQEIEDFWPDEPKQHPSPVTTPEVSLNVSGEPSDSPLSKDVFIIHGHDHGTKEEVARFLSRTGLNPIILHEQSNRGRAVIEKFEKYAAVSYAIALLTPDDVGATKAEADKLRPRPRQNVLFEFGYFIGKLGRERVCGLVKGGAEIPSDYSGVLLISLDNGEAWRLELLRELRDAKLPIDVNAAL